MQFSTKDRCLCNVKSRSESIQESPYNFCGNRIEVFLNIRIIFCTLHLFWFSIYIISQYMHFTLVLFFNTWQLCQLIRRNKNTSYYKEHSDKVCLKLVKCGFSEKDFGKVSDKREQRLQGSSDFN